MASYSKQILSGSTNGRVIPVAATATPGTTIHTALASPTIDEVYLFASNTDTSDQTLTIEWGGVTDPGDHVCKAYVIPAKSPPIPVVTGLVLTGALVIKAFSGSASKINISGFVNRIS